VSTYDWLLTFHLAGALLFLGGSAAAAVLNVLAVRADRPSETARLLRRVRPLVPVIGAGGGIALALGIALWTERGYPLATGWLWGAVALWVVASALGGAGGRHQARSRRLAERLAADGDASTAELQALLRDPKGMTISWLAGAAIVAILVLMLWKP